MFEKNSIANQERSNIMNKSEQYKQYFTNDYMMGPNCVRIVEELLAKYPLEFSSESKLLDLGCGTGLTSYFLANETNATIYANDLWIQAEANKERFKQWGMENQILPFQEDATSFQFEKSFFDAIVSVDAYHYFGGKEDFLTEKILPFVKSGGIVLLAVPGMKEQYEGKQRETIHEWLGEDDYMFHSGSWWKQIIGKHPSIEFVHTWELESFHIAWSEWLQMDNEYANGDRKFFDAVIKKYTNFVGIAVKKKHLK